jgi:hypothetical protein
MLIINAYSDVSVHFIVAANLLRKIELLYFEMGTCISVPKFKTSSFFLEVKI